MAKAKIVTFKIFTSILLSLFSVSALAANGSGNVSNVTNIGGATLHTTTTGIISVPPVTSIPNGDIGKYKTLIAADSTGAAGNFYPFYDMQSASNAIYQVPNGVAFYVTQICLVNLLATAENNIQIGTATATFTTGAAAPTGAVYQAGKAGNYPLSISQTGGAQETTFGCFNFPYKISSNLFPFAQMTVTGGNGMTILVGIEK